MKLALSGYGKMGKMIEQIARERGHEIVSIIDIDNQEEFESVLMWQLNSPHRKWLTETT